ncbi:hypothetical protein GGI12_000447 [Dipsacomyces acuminosporus]|nr:hypothetical protein GGI12_000447 [Dipsacomyces acuminosporus]
MDVKLKTVLSINPYVLSQLSNLKKAFSRTYMMQLTQLLKRCQVAMLRDYIEYKGSITEEYDSLASDDKTITKLTELWMHLYVLPSCSAGVRETIARDQSHFNILISKPKLHVDKEVFGVIP